MTWDRLFWGIEFSSNADHLGNKPMLIGGRWHEENMPRYVGEPSRPILFMSRKLARDWCKKQREKYKDYKDGICEHWRWRPVRVRETVAMINSTH